MEKDTEKAVNTTAEKSSRIWALELEIAKLKAEQDKLKTELQNGLVNEGVYSTYKDDFWEVHHKLGAVTTKFDEAAFEKAEPELYLELSRKYSKTSVGKDSWNWTKQKKIIKG